MKFRVYGALHKLRLATPAELADEANTTVERVYQVMIGDGDDYRRDTALLMLRVADLRGLPSGEAFSITTRGSGAYLEVRDRLER